MPDNNNHKPDFARAVAPWIRGKQIAVYLRGREKPMTGLTVCAVYPSVIVARWNSSTHLINNEAIIAIRFAPDCDPTRDRDHPLHANVSLRRSAESPQPPPKDYPTPSDNPADALQNDPAYISGAALIRFATEKLTEGLTSPKSLSPGSPTRHDRPAQRVNTPPAYEKLQKGRQT